MTTRLGLTECNHSKIRWVEQNNKELRIKHLDIVFDTYLKIYHKKKPQLVAFFNEIKLFNDFAEFR
jgi:late competence protein required for DNA uptake (superfamily II DNA/RNA helicase)